MRISRIRVNNFKSLVDFDMPLSKFTCLIGLNGSGKSTVLQFLDFLGQLMRGRMDDWFASREWDSSDVRSQFATSSTISFEVFLENEQIFANWRGKYNCETKTCDEETIHFGDEVITVKNGICTLKGGTVPNSGTINFDYSGSILSQIRGESLPPGILRLRDFLRNMHSLDTLTPDYLRQRTREARGSLGHGGRQLSAYISELPNEQKQQIDSNLQAMYLKPVSVLSKTIQSGWKQLEILEEYQTPDKMFPEMTTEAKHVNDGTLRLIAFLAELLSQHDFILLDEIENGINPEIIEKLVDKLVAARQQIVVTTHSPMILNYLEDEVARKSVIYLYKTDAGHTQAIPFFDIPSVVKKLQYMGPGEVFVDTKLTALASEIAALRPKAGAA